MLGEHLPLASRPCFHDAKRKSINHCHYTIRDSETHTNTRCLQPIFSSVSPCDFPSTQQLVTERRYDRISPTVLDLVAIDGVLRELGRIQEADAARREALQTRCVKAESGLLSTFLIFSLEQSLKLDRVKNDRCHVPWYPRFVQPLIYASFSNLDVFAE